MLRFLSASVEWEGESGPVKRQRRGRIRAHVSHQWRWRPRRSTARANSESSERPMHEYRYPILRPLEWGVEGSSAVTRCATLCSSGGSRPLCRNASSISGGRHTEDTRRGARLAGGGGVALEKPGAMRPSSVASSKGFCSALFSLYSLRHVSRSVSFTATASEVDDMMCGASLGSGTRCTPCFAVTSGHALCTSGRTQECSRRVASGQHHLLRVNEENVRAAWTGLLRGDREERVVLRDDRLTREELVS